MLIKKKKKTFYLIVKGKEKERNSKRGLGGEDRVTETNWIPMTSCSPPSGLLGREGLLPKSIESNGLIPLWECPGAFPEGVRGQI